MLADAVELIEAGRQLDGRVRPVVLRVGLSLIRHPFGVLQERLIDAAKSEGFTVERRPVVEFHTLLGPLEVESVQLYSRELGEGRRPMREWREVRTGFARRKDQVEPLYVCRRGNGLKEALEFCFAKIQTILDPPHLPQQFYDVAAVLGLEKRGKQIERINPCK